MATYKELYDAYFTEINNICEMLGRYVTVYRTLIDGANALNNIAFSKKSDIKKALKRANTMGDIIDELIEAIEEVDFCYLDYLQSKSGYISHNVPKRSVFDELGSGLFFAGQFNNINNMPEAYKNVFKNGISNFGKYHNHNNNGGNNVNGGNNSGGNSEKSDAPSEKPPKDEQPENDSNGYKDDIKDKSDDIVYKDEDNDIYDNDDIESTDDMQQNYDENSDYNDNNDDYDE